MSKSLVAGYVLFGIAATALFLTARARRQSQPDYAKWPNGYTADFNSTDTSDPAKNCSGRIYVNTIQEPRGLRRDTICAGRKRIYIWRQDGQVDMVLDPDAKTFWKLKSGGHLDLPNSGGRKYVGCEEINGRPVDHYEEANKQAGNGGQVGVVHSWEDLRLHTTVRVTTPTSRYELTNLQEGNQPEALFTVPESFREIPPPN
jgi:hypothetical protein